MPKFYIQDENEGNLFFCEEKFSFLGSRFVFKDREKNEILSAKKNLFSFIPQYKIKSNEKLYATLTKDYQLLKQKFILKYSNGEIVEIIGNLFDYEYEILYQGENIAKVSKNFYSFRDKYGVVIYKENQAQIILFCVILIDSLLHKKSS
jgi:uncharacterized protein YxjI